MKTALITGGSGMVGTALTELLLQHGYKVRHLSTRGERRKLRNGVEVFPWNPDAETMDPGALSGVHYVFHLAGASISGRWTQAYKKEIMDSRVKSAEVLYRTISRMDIKPLQIISASAVGYYPSSEEKVYSENDTADTNFLGKVCQAWEQGVSRFSALGMKEARLRIGIVVSSRGGFLPVVAQPVRWFAGTPIAGGRQFIPWIHLEDLARMFLHVAEHGVEGPVNAAGEKAVSQYEFTKVLGKVLRRPVWPISVPKFALRLALGESAQLAWMSTRVSVRKIQESGFAWKHGDLEEALRKELA